MGKRSVGRLPRAAALLVLLAPASAMADRHTAGVGVGGGKAGRSSLGAFVLTGDWPCWHFGEVDPAGRHALTLSLAGEFSYASGDHKDGTLTQYVFQVGPRLMLNTPLEHRVQLYVVGLIGATSERNYRDRTSLSMAGGVGADVPVAGEGRVVFRGQYTWNWIDNQTSDNTYGQWSAAAVYRFGENAGRKQHASPGPPPKP
jgi:hypothetical protein